MFKRFIPDPFIVVLLATIAVATLLPARGVFADIVGAVSTALITLLFFFHGAKLSSASVLAALMHWRLHVVIVAATFAIFPLLAFGLAKLGSGWMAPELWLGVLFLAALPSTVQSSIAFTSLARGNVPAAIAAASASQLLGVLVTPPLLVLLAGPHGAPPIGTAILKIVALVLVPFLAGQVARPWIGDWIQTRKSLIGLTDRGTIAVAVYSAFSAAVVDGLWIGAPPLTLAILLGVCTVILVAMLAMTMVVSRMMGFNREDRITIVFCGTKKSLVQGIPMARILFPGPGAGLVILPLMLFHQIQLMACAWLARRSASDHEVE